MTSHGPSPVERPAAQALWRALAAVACALLPAAGCLAGDSGVYFRDGGYPDAGGPDAGPDAGPDSGPDAGPGAACLPANTWTRTVAATLFACASPGDVPCAETIDESRGGTWTAQADLTAGTPTHLRMRWQMAGMVRDLELYSASGLQVGASLQLIASGDAGVPDAGGAVFDESLNELPERLGVACLPMGGTVTIAALAFPDAGPTPPASAVPSTFSATYSLTCVRSLVPHMSGCISWDAAAALLDGGPLDAGAVPLPANDGVTLGSLAECAARNSAFVEGDPGDGLHPGAEYFDFGSAGTSRYPALFLDPPTFDHFEQIWSVYPTPYPRGIFDIALDGNGTHVNLGQIYTTGPTGSLSLALHDVSCTVDESQFQVHEFAAVSDSGGSHISKLTATFLQHCAGASGFLRGCLHLEP